MRVLVVKLTSMGDVLHLMPALTDLKMAQPEIVVDWMVEDSFAEIPTWHPIVNKVLKVSTRRWHKLSLSNIAEFLRFLKELRHTRYDVVIDAQGLMKSAVLARLAKLSSSGFRAGFSGDSIKESPAARLYNKKVSIQRQQHAIDRLRQLFAKTFNYTVPTAASLNYGLIKPEPTPVKPVNNRPTILLFHGTTWPSKHIPDTVWKELAELISNDGYCVAMSWGNEIEKQRAEWVAKDSPGVSILPKSTLNSLAQTLTHASGAIAVDTGLGHMAAAFGVPSVSIYGSTNSTLTGTLGTKQFHLQSDYPCSPCLLKQCDKLTKQVTLPPCYQHISAAKIWQTLYTQIL